MRRGQHLFLVVRAAALRRRSGERQAAYGGERLAPGRGEVCTAAGGTVHISNSIATYEKGGAWFVR
jgi:hypothetical protein